MSVIEDIIREINNASRRMRTNEIPAKYYRAIGTRKAEEIIRKHMNDGWIPVEERLPENAEDVIATLANGEGITLAWYDKEIMELKERDTPKKPKLINGGSPVCPECGEGILRCYAFCKLCGQRLDQ